MLKKIMLGASFAILVITGAKLIEGALAAVNRRRCESEEPPGWAKI